MSTPDTQTLLEKGIAAAKLARQKPTSGEPVSAEQLQAWRKEARSLLERVLKVDRSNVQAWLWLSTMVDTRQEQKICFKRVLAIDPNHKYASKCLAKLEDLDRQPIASPPTVSKTDDEPAKPALKTSSKIKRLPSKKRTRTKSRISRIQPSSAQTSKSDPSASPSVGRQISTATPKSEPPRCPFCQEPITSTDTTCPHCQLLLSMSCPACHETVDVEQAACNHCGQEMGDYQQRLTYFADLGVAYLEKQHYQDAAKAWEMVEILAPNFPLLYLRLGQSHLGADHHGRATAYLRQALEQTPNHAELQFTLGELMRQHGMHEDALSYYQTATQLDPKQGLAWLRTAEIFERVGEKKEAMKAYHTVTTLFPATADEYSQALAQLQLLLPKLPESMVTGWPEFIRQMTGPILICLLTVLFDSGLRPWWISLIGGLALLIGPVGTFLFVSGYSLPRNPLMQKFLGKQGLATTQDRRTTMLVGALLWLTAMALVLLPINQPYPDIPPYPEPPEITSP